MLPTFAVATATGPNRTFGPGQALRPCSPPHTRPACRIAATAGGLLPHRFTPYPHPFRGRWRVCSLLRLWSPEDYSSGAPAFGFAGRRCPFKGLGVGRFLRETGLPAADRRLPQGAGGGTRTPTPLTGHGSSARRVCQFRHSCTMGREGVEPSAPGLKGQYSTC